MRIPEKMTELVACLSTGKGTWGHVSHLIKNEKWDRVFLITNEYGKQNFTADDRTELLEVNMDIGLKELKEQIREQLKPRIKGTEVAVNVISGAGKEHMALIAALLQIGVGIRLIAVTKNGIEEV